MYLLLPLLAAIAFAFGSMVYKRAFEEGAGIAHAVVFNNVVLGILFLPLLALEPRPIPWGHWHHPALTATAFVTGHLLNVLSLRVGDVSLATPLLGSKIIIVALIGWWLFGTQLGAAHWWAAGLSTLGVAVMGVSDHRPAGRVGLTVALALGCSVAFAFTDTMIAAWGGDFGVWSFLALQFVALGALSLLALPFLGRRPLHAPAPAWKWIVLATLLSGMQAIIITATIGIWRDAAGVNVVYATRGPWSVLLVWWIGHWVGSKERHALNGRLLAWRLAGALLILAGVVIVARVTP